MNIRDYLFRDSFGLGMPDVIPGSGSTPGGGYVAEYQAVYDEFATKPSDADADAQNTFMQVGVTDGWLSDLDRLFIFASHASGADSLLDWCNPSVNSATLVNAPSWTIYQGYLGNGTTQYINSNYNPNTDAINWNAGAGTQSVSFGVYLRTQNIAGVYYDIGCDDGGDSRLSAYLAGNFRGSVLTSADFLAANANTQGMFTAEAFWESGVGHSQESYKNGISHNKQTGEVTDQTTGDIFILATGGGGTPAGFSPRECSMAFTGGDLGSTKQLSLYNAFQALMTHYGTDV